jgi:serine/threonine protein kinase
MSSSNMSGSGVVVQGGGWFIDSFNGNIKEQYHFIEKLASGGFGVVYLAEHRKTSKHQNLSNWETIIMACLNIV